MDSIRKRKLFDDAIMGLKNVENLFGAQVLQKESVALTKEEEKLFCTICNEIQMVMQHIYDHSQTIHRKESDDEKENYYINQSHESQLPFLNYIMSLSSLTE